MNETGISIPWWGWLALIAALVDRKLVRYGKRLGGHYIAWPREWCNQEEAAGRGALTVNELWPDETAEPIAHRRFKWVQRTKRM